jgi:hypothetical protein
MQYTTRGSLRSPLATIFRRFAAIGIFVDILSFETASEAPTHWRFDMEAIQLQNVRSSAPGDEACPGAAKMAL